MRTPSRLPLTAPRIVRYGCLKSWPSAAKNSAVTEGFSMEPRTVPPKSAIPAISKTGSMRESREISVWVPENARFSVSLPNIVPSSPTCPSFSK